MLFKAYLGFSNEAVETQKFRMQRKPEWTWDFGTMDSQTGSICETMLWYCHLYFHLSVIQVPWLDSWQCNCSF